MIHGLGGTSNIYQVQAEALAEDTPSSGLISL